MTSITPKSRTLTNGTTADATPVEQNFIDLYSNDTALASDVTALQTGSLTISGNKTFTGTTTFSGSVVLAGTVTLTGILNLAEATDPSSPAVGDIWYNSTDHVFKFSQQIGAVSGATNATPIVITTSAAHNRSTGDSVYISNVAGNTAANGTWTITVTGPNTFSLDTSVGNGAYTSGGTVEFNVQLVTLDQLGAFPKGYRSGSHPTWTSVASVTVPAGYACRDSSDSANIVVDSDLVVSLASAGSLGLDSGTEAISTWYFVWLCKGSSGVTAIFSTSSTSPTLPTGYDLYKRRLPGAWRNNASSDLIKSVFGGSLYFPTVYHRVACTPTASSNPTNIVSTTSSLTNVDTSAYVAPDALTAILYHHHSSSSGSSIVQPAGDSSSEYITQTQSASNGVKDQQKDIILRLDATQKIDVTIVSATNVIAVRGYVVTEAA